MIVIYVFQFVASDQHGLGKQFWIWKFIKWTCSNLLNNKASNEKFSSTLYPFLHVEHPHPQQSIIDQVRQKFDFTEDEASNEEILFYVFDVFLSIAVESILYRLYHDYLNTPYTQYTYTYIPGHSSKIIERFSQQRRMVQYHFE